MNTTLAHTAAQNLLRFIDSSPTPFHAVKTMKDMLLLNGFTVLQEEDEWKLALGGRYIVTRNGSTIAAFVIGTVPPLESGFRMIVAHTDSPNLRLKPNPVFEKNGYMQFGIEPYGGVLLASWLNRDLSMAGRVIVRSHDGLCAPKLLKLETPFLSIPQLSIHLNPKVNDEGLVLHKQHHLPPVVGLVDSVITSPERFDALLRDALVLTQDENIVGVDIALYDTQPSAFGGINGEFIYAPRLDNLASCHAATVALSGTQSPLRTCLMVCCDHEEVGSLSAQGASSSFLRDVLERITFSFSPPSTGDALQRAIARSCSISMDMSHAVHPNHSDKHDPHHMPMIGQGPVLKSNVNQRYASDGYTSAYFARLCGEAGISYQNFVCRTDLGCGTTIGPITSSLLGMRTVDVGNPMLSMHAIREQAGVADHHAIIRLAEEHFTEEDFCFSE